MSALDQTPVISVVIPVYNGAPTIGVQLDALIHQAFSEPWEIIVSDNGSTDGTQSVVERHARNSPVPIRLIDASGRRGAAHARNVGIGSARSDAFACCDADDVVMDGWLASAFDALTKFSFATGSKYLFSKSPADTYAIWDPANLPGIDGLQLDGCNFCGLRAAYCDVGGMDESFARWGSEDIELSVRVALHGYETVGTTDMRIHYRLPRRPWRQAKKWWQGGRNSVMLWRLHPEFFAHRLGISRSLRELASLPTYAIKSKSLNRIVEHCATISGALIEQLMEIAHRKSVDSPTNRRSVLYVSSDAKGAELFKTELPTGTDLSPTSAKFVVCGETADTRNHLMLGLRAIRGRFGPRAGLVASARTVRMAVRATSATRVVALDSYATLFVAEAKARDNRESIMFGDLSAAQRALNFTPHHRGLVEFAARRFLGWRIRKAFHDRVSTGGVIHTHHDTRQP